MADDDSTEPPTDPPADDPTEGLGDDGRPLGRVVQLERPRPRRRRGGGSATDATRPDGRWSADLAAGEHERTCPGDDRVSPRGGAEDVDGPGGSPDGPRDEQGSGDGTPGAGDAPGASGEPGALGGAEGADATGAGRVATLTTLRGRRGRRSAPDGAAATPADSSEGGPDGGDGGPALLHPRMRSRRIAVRRSEGLRRLRRLTWGLAGLALVVDGVALAHTGFVDVDRFEVAGSVNTLPAAVQHASGIQGGDALLTLDESAAERRIEALPWVAEADVVRQWPGTVRITVTERQPLAVLQVSEDPAAPLALVDATGRVLDIGARPEGLIAVTEVPPRLAEGSRVPAEARDALEIARAASERIPGAIVSLTVGLEATLGGGGVVRFGSVDDLDTKLMALGTVLARVDLECLDSLNLAVADHPALTRSC